MDAQVQAAIWIVYAVTSSKEDVTRALGIIADHPPIAAAFCATQEVFAKKSPRFRLNAAEVRDGAMTLLFLLIRDGRQDRVPTPEDILRLFRRRLSRWAKDPDNCKTDHAEAAPAQRFIRLTSQAREAGVEPTIAGLAEFFQMPVEEVRTLEAAFKISRAQVYHCDYAIRSATGTVVAIGSRKKRRRRSDGGNNGAIEGVEDLCDQHDRCRG